MPLCPPPSGHAFCLFHCPTPSSRRLLISSFLLSFLSPLAEVDRVPVSLEILSDFLRCGQELLGERSGGCRLRCGAERPRDGSTRAGIPSGRSPTSRRCGFFRGCDQL